MLISPFILGDLTPAKISLPNEITEEGIVFCANEEHSENALFPIEVTEERNITCSTDEHPLKAPFPIEVIEDGIVKTFNEKHNLDKPNFIGLQIKDSISFGKKKKFNESTIMSPNLS